MRRCGSTSSSSPSPLAAAALLLLLVVAGCFHEAAAARLLPSSVPGPALVHHAAAAAESGAKAASGAADGGGLALQEGDVGNGDELSTSGSEMIGADESEEEEACEEGNEDCMQRRLLHDAHLDYIYTQHKGKP